MDEIKYLAGEKNKNIWQFYHNGFPSASIIRKSQQIPNSFENLEKAAIKLMVDILKVVVVI